MIAIRNLPLEEEHFMTCPYREISHIGDPAAIYVPETGKYYMYCTGGKFKCWSSETMKHWDPIGDSYLATEKTFGTRCFWAPEVYSYNGAYYMVYSASNDEKLHSIGIARSEKPEGPFTDLYDHPLFSPGYSVIDGSLLFDEDRIYLFYSRDCSQNYVNGIRTSQTYGVEVKKDLSGIIGEPVLLATPVSPWEKKSGSVLWNEGPCCFRHNGTYYLLFTANYYASSHYCVGYATATAPLGPYTKSPDNPIVIGDGVTTSGTGHCNSLLSSDGTERYMIYHSHFDVKDTDNPIANRTPCCDKMIIREDGSLVVNGPSIARQPLPSGARGLEKKYSGVTVTADILPVSGSLSMLTDGIVAYTPHADRDICRFSGNFTVTVRYDEPVALDALWIYSAYNAENHPSVTAVFNRKYRTDPQSFPGTPAIEPVVFTGASLPDAEKVSEIALSFTGAPDGFPLSELISVVRKENNRDPRR